MRGLALLLFLSLIGCATTPLAVDQATPVPASRILAPQLITHQSNTGILVVKRDSGFMGSACTIRVFVDAVPVADLSPSEKIELYIPLGEHSVVVSSPGFFAVAALPKPPLSLCPSVSAFCASPVVRVATFTCNQARSEAGSW